MSSRTSTKAARGASSHAREIGGIVLLAVGAFLLLSLSSLQFGDGRLMGPLGRLFGRLVYGAAGVVSYVVGGATIVAAIRILSHRAPVRDLPEGAGLPLGVLSISILLHLVAGDYRVAGYGPGGLLGEYVGELLRAAVGAAGAALLGVAGLLIALVATTPLEMAHLGRAFGFVARHAWAGVRFVAVETVRFLGELIGALLPDRDEAADEDEETADAHEAEADAETEGEPGERAAKKKEKGKAVRAELDLDAIPIAGMDGDTIRVGEPEREPIIVEPPRPRRERRKKDEADGTAATGVPAAGVAMSAPAAAVASVTASSGSASAGSSGSASAGSAGSASSPSVASGPGSSGAALPASVAAAAATAPGTAASATGATPTPARPEPVIVEPGFRAADKKQMAEKEKQLERPDYIPLGDGRYQLPPLSLLKYDDTHVHLDREAMKELAARLVTTLETYGIKGQVTAIRPGPVVTMYEFAPAPGTRVSKIAGLADDLAMALEALSVRIVAPIPGKAAVGIEVPNKHRETVFLKEILADDVFQKAKSKLQIALGKDSEGRPVAVDLAKMPHLLVAGTTGAGKSVSVNAMIASILYSATPEEVRLIMVDPKMLELSVYEGIPHLLLPVVTDPQKANLALKWAVAEMERRYQLMAEEGVKDILSYNRKVEKAASEPPPEPAEEVPAEGVEIDADGQRRLVFAVGTSPGRKPPLRKMPYIVVVIDEFADLMMCAPKEVEHSVTRLAQKARACGIHLLLATQRPTTEVITGLIKSNIPSRIAFRVTNKVNSIAILEQAGAEALLGQGDMLFSDRGTALRRVHGCLVQDEEIHALTEFLKKQGKPVYDMDILKPPPDEAGDEDDPGDPADDLSDEMYDRAVALVAETRTASVSWIQRRLRVGYNRAARMIERMEREGVVGPAQHGSNRREVLIQNIPSS